MHLEMNLEAYLYIIQDHQRSVYTRNSGVGWKKARFTSLIQKATDTTENIPIACFS